jgi:hypothetical protein
MLAHLRTAHAVPSGLVKCPICVVNNNIHQLHMRLIEHMESAHCNAHDPVSHVMLHMPDCSPLYIDRKFTVLPPFTLLPDPDVSSSSSSGVPPTPEDFEAAMVHPLTQCHRCGVSPIRGVCYTCYNCGSAGGGRTLIDDDGVALPSHATHAHTRTSWAFTSTVDLCSECYPHRDDCHSTAHVFLMFRRALDRSSSPTGANPRLVPAMPLLYPAGIVSSFGFNVSTELFFVTLYFLHLGLLRTCARYASLKTSLEADEVPRHQHEALLKIQLSVEAQLQPMLGPGVRTYATLAKLVLHRLRKDRTGLVQLPQPAEVKPQLRITGLPEIFWDDLADLILFCARYNRDVLGSLMDGSGSGTGATASDVRALFHVLLFLLDSPEYVRNPYLRAKFVEVLCSVAPTPTNHGPGCMELAPFFQTDALMVRHLAPALMRLFSAVEHTGMGSELGVQFYDKFSIRHAISVLLNYTFTLDAHRETIARVSHETDAMVRFINGLLNDLSFLMDDVLSKVSAVYDALAVRHDAAAWAALSGQAKLEAENSLITTRRTLKTVSTFAGITLQLFHALCAFPPTRSVAALPVLVTRVAHTINYFLMRLGNLALSRTATPDDASASPGDAVSTLTVTLPHAIPSEATASSSPASSATPQPSVTKAVADIQRKELIQMATTAGVTLDPWLALLWQTAVTFHGTVDFEAAVVSDGRSYKPELFANVVAMLQARSAIGPMLLANIEEMTERLQQAAAVNAAADDGEVPDEFLDPITAVLMDDPVVLPTSNQTMDRAVIERHLLSTPLDPFNRAKLTPDMLVPNVELKKAIDEWRRTRLLPKLALVSPSLSSPLRSPSFRRSPASPEAAAAVAAAAAAASASFDWGAAAASQSASALAVASFTAPPDNRDEEPSP